MRREKRPVSEKEVLQSAADEARKAARAGREFAGLLDDYAKYLTQPSFRQRADETYRAALNKLNVVKDTLASCAKWVEGSPKNPVVAHSQPPVQSEVIEKQEVVITHKPRSIRITKKAVGT